MKRTVSDPRSLGDDGAISVASRRFSPGQRCRQAAEKAMKQGDLGFAGYYRLAAWFDRTYNFSHE